MSAYRWERERSAWLLNHSRPATSRRRRAELLQKQAGRAARKARTGQADAARHEDITPSLFRRMLATDEGSGEKLLRLIAVPVIFGIAGLAIGPALLLAAGIYALLWRKSPEIGRLWVWPWITAGSVVAVIGAVVWNASGAGLAAWIEPWPLALHVCLPVFAPVWFWIQVALGLALAGVRIRESGWAAVKPRAGRGKTGPQKNEDGSFKRVADEDVVQLVPFGGDRDDDADEKPDEGEQSHPMLGALAPETVDEDEEQAAAEGEQEDEPIFTDDFDDEDLVVVTTEVGDKER